jgi:hypothetical protein
MTAMPTVNTRKNVPMNSTPTLRWMLIIRSLCSSGSQSSSGFGFRPLHAGATPGAGGGGSGDDGGQVLRALARRVVSHTCPHVNACVRECCPHSVGMRQWHEAISITEHGVDRSLVLHASTVESVGRTPGLRERPRRLPGSVDETTATACQAIDQFPLGQLTVGDDGGVSGGHREPAREPNPKRGRG